MTIKRITKVVSTCDVCGLAEEGDYEPHGWHTLEIFERHEEGLDLLVSKDLCSSCFHEVMSIMEKDGKLLPRS